MSLTERAHSPAEDQYASKAGYVGGVEDSSSFAGNPRTPREDQYDSSSSDDSVGTQVTTALREPQGTAVAKYLPRPAGPPRTHSQGQYELRGAPAFSMTAKAPRDTNVLRSESPTFALSPFASPKAGAPKAPEGDDRTARRGAMRNALRTGVFEEKMRSRRGQSPNTEDEVMSITCAKDSPEPSHYASPRNSPLVDATINAVVEQQQSMWQRLQGMEERQSDKREVETAVWAATNPVVSAIETMKDKVAELTEAQAETQILQEINTKTLGTRVSETDRRLGDLQQEVREALQARADARKIAQDLAKLQHEVEAVKRASPRPSINNEVDAVRAQLEAIERKPKTTPHLPSG